MDMSIHGMGHGHGRGCGHGSMDMAHGHGHRTWHMDISMPHGNIDARTHGCCWALHKKGWIWRDDAELGLKVRRSYVLHCTSDSTL